MSGEGSALTKYMKGELEMTYAEQFEQMPFVFKLTIGFVGGLALMFAGVVAMTLLLVILKVAIGGLC